MVVRFLFTWHILVSIVAIQGKNKSTNSSNQNKDKKWNGEIRNIPKNGELFEGDIIMDNRFRHIIRHAKSKKSALIYFGLLDVTWPDGIVYYIIDRSFNPWNRVLLERVMKEFESRTCIRFKYRQQYERNYVIFTSRQDACFANIGRIGGPQIINLSGSCARLGTFQHEIMHALGIIHEQSRPDRDRFIQINTDNIRTKDIDNFAKYSYYEIDNLREEFNFNSVMLYPNYAFSKNGRNTIQAIKEPHLKFGQRLDFSVGDVREINRLYKCHRPRGSHDYTGLVKDYHVEDIKRYQPHSGYFGQFEVWMMTLQDYLEEYQLSFVF